MASPLGTKRLVERSMEKCSGCRLKRIKCLPITRDWSRRQRCIACETKGEPCGPNTRAPRLCRNPTPNIGSNNRALAPSSSPNLLIPSVLDTSSTQTVSVHQSGSSSGDLQLSPSDLDAEEAPPTDSWKPLPLTSPAPLSTRPHDSLTASFIHLGDLRNTLENVQNRLQSISFNIPRSSRSSSDPDIETALEFTVYGTQNKFSSEIANILGSASDLEPNYAEPVLRRALDAIDDFSDIVGGPAPSEALSCHHSILKSKATILRRLISIYEKRGDFPEVERLFRKVSALPDCAKLPSDQDLFLRVAKSLSRTSRRMQEVLVELEIPEKHKKSLYLTGADPFPPIHRALLHQDSRLIRHLVEISMSPFEQVDIVRRLPVHIAAETSNLDFLDFLSPEDRRILQMPDLSKRTALYIAASQGHLLFFKKLAKAGADLDSRDEDGRSVLSVACGAGHLPIVQFLLDENVSPNDDVLSACSPLLAAASAGHTEVCRVLLDHGAWTDWCSNDKLASQLARQNGHSQIVQLIAEFEGRPANCCPYNPWSICTDNFLLDPIPTSSEILPPSTPVQHSTGLCSPSLTGQTTTANYGSRTDTENEPGEAPF